MDLRFDGQVAVVTGGSQGIGFAVARMLLESGAKVAVIADRLNDCERELAAYGTVKAYELNILEISRIPTLIGQIRAELGEIDVLVNAAGIMPTVAATEITEEQWDTAFGVNAKGMFFMMQAVGIQSMIPRGSGAIVNFISMAGVRGMQHPLCSMHYSASKGAAAQLTRQGATEWGMYGIRVNAVVPGPVKVGRFANAPEEIIARATATIPLKQLAEPEDVASTVCFLASRAAKDITGQLIYVDGGGSTRY